MSTLLGGTPAPPAAPGEAAPGSEPPPSGFSQEWPRTVRGLLALVAALLVGAGAGFQPVVGAALLVVVTAGLVLLSRPALGAVLVVAVAPAVAGLARGLVVPGARLGEALIGGVAVIVLVLTRVDEPRWRAVDACLLLFATLTLVLGLAGSFQHLITLDGPAVASLTQPLQFVLASRVTVTALRRPADRVVALRWTLVVGGAVAALSIAQRVVPSVQATVVSLTGSDNYAFNELYFVPRATGPFPIWHFLGAYLMLITLLATALLAQGDRQVLSARGLLLVAALSTTGVVLTLTLAILFGLVVGLVVVALWSPRPRVYLLRGLAVTLAAGLAASPLIAGRLSDQTTRGSDSLVPQTLSFRWTVWTQQYLPALRGRWLLGYGPTIPPEVFWRYTESVYVTYLLQGGVLLLSVFLVLEVLVWRAMSDLRRAADPVRLAAASTVAAVTAALVPMHTIFPYMTGLGMPQLYWALVGLALAGTGSGRSATAH